MRAVLDPNVFVSALLAPAGTSAMVVRAGLAGRFRIVVCPRLIDELDVVLGRWKFRRYFTVEEADDFVASVLVVADEEPDPANVEAISRDPDDDYLVALAREASADRLVRATTISMRFALHRCGLFRHVNSWTTSPHSGGSKPCG